MSTANNATFTTGGVPQRSQEYGDESVLSASKSMSYGITEFGDGQTTLGPGNFDTQGQNYTPVPDYGFYPQYQSFSHGHAQTFASNDAIIDSSSLHPTTSLSPSTAQDHFSPSDFPSDTAGFREGFSPYSTPGYDNTFSDPQFSILNMQDTTRGISGQFSSPEQINSQPSIFNHHVSGPHINSSSPQMPTSMPQAQPAFDGQQQTLPHQNTLGISIQQPTNHSNQFHSTNTNGNSPNIALSPSPEFQRPKLVVTIEDDDAGPAKVSDPRETHRRNSSKRSNTHLSPYPNEDSSSEEDENPSRRNAPAVQRNPDGTWARDASGGQSGLGPESRAGLNVDDMPTLDDMEERRKREEKNAEVEDWLTHSEVGSDGENHGGSMKGRRKKFKNRPRAKSTNDASFDGSYPEGLDVSYYAFNNVAIPGPGATINEPSDMGDDEESEGESGPESPAADITPFVDSESYFPLTTAGTFPSAQKPASLKGKTTSDLGKSIAGITANLAIMRFRQRAKDTDNASVTATLGTRRNSESDIGSVLGAAGISKLLLSPPQQTERNPVQRKSSFLGNIREVLPSRNNSNKLKRKNSHPIEHGDNTGSGGANSPKDTQGGFAAPKRIGSFGRSKTPKVDTNVPSAANDARSPKAVASAASGAIKQIWRSRSRSDLGKTPNLGIAELWTKAGGPPMPTLASPSQNRVAPAVKAVAAADDDSDNEDGGAATDGLTMDLSVRTDMHILPTYDGFKYHAHQLNPRLADFLLERITQEQVKRYKRLVDFKTKHSQSVATGSCSSKSRCFASGGNSTDLPARPGNKDPDNALVGFQIMRPGMTEDDLEVTNEGQMIAATFPSGVPLPPVNRLPAEFECSLCFKVKKFYKPSDWTKHVHEDLQPFTCTFAGCNEPKSFKRKADWVRHENERHRQLEYWTCNFQDCAHTCYRKDNFVQHLVREHKVPEPKVRTGRQGGSRSPLTPFDPSQTWQSQLGLPNLSDDGVDDVWALVDKCHQDSIKQPKDEPCKFCGNICTSWKKLTVHLAKHMEQITMPVLPLVDQKRTTVDFPSTNMHVQQPAPLTNVATKPLNELPKFLYEEPMEMQLEPQNMMAPLQMMRSYPLTALQMSTQADFANSTPASLTGQSYPPPSQQRSRASSFNSQQDFNMRQGSSYPPVGINSRAMNNGSPHAHYDNGQNLFFQQPSVFMQEPGTMNVGPYLTPSSNTPQSLGYHSSPEGSTHDLSQYGGGYQ